MADVSNLNLLLTCAVCMDIPAADNAIETSCCHQLFCSTCIVYVFRCPICRNTNFDTIPAYLARRLISNLTTQNLDNGSTARIRGSDEESNDHAEASPVRIRGPEEPNDHAEASEDVVRGSEEELNGHVAARVVRIRGSGEEPNERVDVAAARNNVIFDDRIERTHNRFGRYARLGSTGKFYCGGELDGFQCSCCNGHCGPSNGCNCSGCMLLDVQKRQLPRGWLVNRDGASARCSPIEPTKFYCGRMVMTHDRRTDGYCGSTNGEQCNACLKLNEQQYQRYEQVWEH